ncbi:MAG: glycosyltransferase family 4 protein [Rhodobiaceae bacterium]|nr:glycosyltransferase family 4 protein [Rhodobiaceae bacterium]MCC0053575.1 glycosyltransferase family 4 protein [Rhodobiaceae bacterium]
MSRIVFADTTGAYDGRTLDERPLGGTESSVIRLARALAARGHAVTCFTNCDAPIEHEGVSWQPVGDTPPATCDLYVAIQHPQLLSLVPRPAKRAIWVLWRPNNLKHYKQIWRMWLYRPVPILMSRFQQRGYSPLLPSRRSEVFIPLGLPDEARGLPPLEAPPPRRALFASNPSRNLSPLVDIWVRRILPAVPDAILDVYGLNGLTPGQDPWQVWAGSHLPAGQPAHVKASIRVHPPTSRDGLKHAMRTARVIPYLGHKSEAFCLTLAEAQALGLPAVVSRLGSVPERVIDNVTGFHRDDEAGFAEATIALLTDDDLWRSQHLAALQRQQGLSWADYAERFEAALLT